MHHVISCSDLHTANIHVLIEQGQTFRKIKWSCFYKLPMVWTQGFFKFIFCTKLINMEALVHHVISCSDLHTANNHVHDNTLHNSDVGNRSRELLFEPRASQRPAKWVSTWRHLGAGRLIWSRGCCIIWSVQVHLHPWYFGHVETETVTSHSHLSRHQTNKVGSFTLKTASLQHVSLKSWRHATLIVTLLQLQRSRIFAMRICFVWEGSGGGRTAKAA